MPIVFNSNVIINQPSHEINELSRWKVNTNCPQIVFHFHCIPAEATQPIHMFVAFPKTNTRYKHSDLNYRLQAYELNTGSFVTQLRVEHRKLFLSNVLIMIRFPNDDKLDVVLCNFFPVIFSFFLTLLVVVVADVISVFFFLHFSLSLVHATLFFCQMLYSFVHCSFFYVSFVL